MTIMLAALLPCRNDFYRKSSLINDRFSATWTVLIAIVILCCIWLGMLSHRHLVYSNEMWWQFAITRDAPRFLRATTAAIVVLLLFGMLKLFYPVSPKSEAGSITDMEKAEPIIKNSRKTYANLALLGDKAFLFSEKQNAFLMYGIEKRSWVALADPVGPEEEWDELIWQFRETADRYGGWSVFYGIENKHIDFYLDLGLTFLKLGEEARVPLQNFSLEGADKKDFRNVRNRFEKEEITLEIIPQSEVPSHFERLKYISDQWLTGKNVREKSFSLGFFDADYLRHFPCAAIRSKGEIIAFANIWAGAGKEELSIDLMRYLPDCPAGVMDFLFAELMLWGKQQGYQWFNLGMAPLSGFEERSLAPLWYKLGTLIFRHGEHFYNFQGLRQYKEKFNPVWESKYIVCPGGLILPSVLLDIAALISRGFKGIAAK